MGNSQNKTIKNLLLRQTDSSLVEIQDLLSVLFLERSFKSFFEANKRILPTLEAIWNEQALMVDSGANLLIKLVESDKDNSEWQFCFDGNVLFTVFFAEQSAIFELIFNENMSSISTNGFKVVKNYVRILLKMTQQRIFTF